MEIVKLHVIIHAAVRAEVVARRDANLVVQVVAPRAMMAVLVTVKLGVAVVRAVAVLVVADAIPRVQQHAEQRVMPHAKEVAKSIVLEYVEILVREAVVLHAAIPAAVFVLMVALINVIIHAQTSAMEIVRAHAKLHAFHLVANLVWVL